MTPCVSDQCWGVKCLGASSCRVMSTGPICTCEIRNCPPSKRQPVCGSDGVSYDSICDLAEQACLQRQEISVAHHGQCTYKGK